MTTQRGWLRTLLRGKPHQIIGGVDDPYMLRWYLIPRNRLLNIYVHRFLRSDDDRALHDHPWWFVSLVLRGCYHEVTDGNMTLRRAGSIAYRPATWRHRVLLAADLDADQESHRQRTGRAAELDCWTLIVTGSRRRSWGFWCPRGFVPWQKFTSPAPGHPEGLGCGEFS